MSPLIITLAISIGAAFAGGYAVWFLLKRDKQHTNAMSRVAEALEASNSTNTRIANLLEHAEIDP